VTDNGQPMLQKSGEIARAARSDSN